MRSLRLAVSAALLALAVGACAVPSPGDAAAAARGHRTAVVSEELPPIPATSPALPATFRGADDTDQKVTDVSRIVVADRGGSLSRIVTALGLGDRIVGRDLASDQPALADVPVVTPGGHALTAEAVLNLAPTVVLTDTSIGPRAVQRGLRDAGIPVVFIPEARSFDDAAKRIRAVAAALGVPAAGEMLATATRDDVASARTTAREASDGRRIAVLYLRGTTVAMVAGRGTGAPELIEAVGAVDAVGANAEGFVPLTPEALVDAAPDTFVVMSAGLESIGGVDGLLRLPGVELTPAGRNRSVVDVRDSLLLSFGPLSGGLIRALAGALYSETGR